jgi:hypothetical protein
MMSTPSTLQLNAWTGPGEKVTGDLSGTAGSWATRGRFPPSGQMLAPEEVARRECWNSDRTGWGIILPERPAEDWSPAEKAAARDAPEAVWQLLSLRGDAPVFRYDGPTLGFHHLRRHITDGGPDEPPIGNEIGIGPGKIPLYLLIVGSPAEIPWDLQYALAQRHIVGRLDLDEEGLMNYVTALSSDWAEMDCQPDRAVVWATDVRGDITREMRSTIAHPIFEALDNDAEVTVGYLAGDEATQSSLVEAASRHPGLIVTTSHGKTAPLADPVAMALDLGKLIDQNEEMIDVDDLLGAWEPRGAVWYAHACCSAGSRAESQFPDLLTEGSLARKVVSQVSMMPSQTAPLPRALLGAPKPLRAFVGQVEPTFDWTLRDGLTGQRLTNDIRQGLYDKLMQPWPIGLAFEEFQKSVGFYTSQWADQRDQVDAGDETARASALRLRLTALDRQSTVILGDPAAILPALPSTARPTCN